MLSERAKLFVLLRVKP